MAQQPAPRKQPRSKREKPQETKAANGQNGHDDQVAEYVQELAGYLQERIKPGLNSGAIPLLARSIANDIAHREPPPGLSDDADSEDKPGAEADSEPTGEAEDEPTGTAEDEDEDEATGDAEADDERSDDEDDEDSTGSDAQADFEADMHDLQAELGEDWILRFSVQGDDAWLTAEKDDGSQRIEAPTAAVLTQAVELLNESGGRSD